jgi:hypothetical protein
MVETTSGLCALKPAEDSAALSRASLKSLEQSAARAAEPHVRTSPASVTIPTATIASVLIATSTVASYRAIQAQTFSGVLLLSHRARISGSSLWSAAQSSAIDRRITSHAATASSGQASRMDSTAFPSLPRRGRRSYLFSVAPGCTTPTIGPSGSGSSSRLSSGA